MWLALLKNPLTKLIGQKKLQEQIEDGWSANKIRKTWQKELATRSRY